MRARTRIFLGFALTAVLTLRGQQSIPPVFLNHVMVVLPSPVYAQLLESAFLQSELSYFNQGTNTAQSDKRGTYTYTGIYLSGWHTYLELFESGKVKLPGDPAPRQAGVIAFNMSIDNRNQIAVIRDRAATEINSSIQVDTIRNAKGLPTYDLLNTVHGPDIAVSAGVKGYYPDGITREKQRERVYLPDRLLRDVTGITVTVNEAELGELLQTFRAFGYAIRKVGEKQIASGPEITFVFLPETHGVPRMLVVELSLNQEKTGTQAYQFAGDSELQFQGNAARWTFKFPSN